MNDVLLSKLVWTDYRLAVLLTVILPIILLIWALVSKTEAIIKLLIIYWRVSSLLMITVYLMIAAWTSQFGFLTSFAAKILIPISLWFWADLNDEIKDLPRNSLKLIFTSWRWATTIYTSIGAIAIIPFLSCAFSPGAIKTQFCRVWLEPTWSYKAIFHANSARGFLGFLGMVGLVFYLLYFAYFLVVRLAKQGRSALEQ